ncbi:MAG: hypothetical protein INR73_20165 [Williamsia sp.]|nr:hypothetical protein [Williamsia sp.]
MQNFLSLNKSEQQDLLSRFGELLIRSTQGNSTTTFYSLYSFYVKVTRDNDDPDKIEALPDLDNLQLHNAGH